MEFDFDPDFRTDFFAAARMDFSVAADTDWAVVGFVWVADRDFAAYTGSVVCMDFAVCTVAAECTAAGKWGKDWPGKEECGAQDAALLNCLVIHR